MLEFHMCLHRRAAGTERTSKRAMEPITISPVLFPIMSLSSPLSPSLLLSLSSSSSPLLSLSLSSSLLSSSLLISSSFSVLSSAIPLILSQQLGGVKSVH